MRWQVVIAAMAAALAIQVDAQKQQPASVESVDVTFVAVDAKASQPLCRGILVARNIVLNWHCLEDMRTAISEGQQVFAVHGGSRVSIARASLADAPASLKLAESAALDFTLLRSPFLTPGVAVKELMTGGQVSLGDVVQLKQDNKVVANCQISYIQGSKVGYAGCDADLLKGWSGSSVWLVHGGNTRLFAMHKQGPDKSPVGAGRLLSAIAGRSSSLFPDKLAFSDEFARNPKNRLLWRPRDIRINDSRSFLTLKPYIQEEGSTIQGMAYQGGHVILTTDLFNGKVCRFEWPSRTPTNCWVNPDIQFRRVNGIQRAGPGLFALAKSNDGKDAHDGTVAFIETDDNGNVTRFDGVDVDAPIGSVYATYPIEGDLVVTGSRGLCVISLSKGHRSCVRPADRDGDWRVNGVLDLGDGLFVAVGRDYLDNVGYPKCAWFRRAQGTWNLLARCRLNDHLNSVARSLYAKQREMQFKAPVKLGPKVVVFGSDGAGYEIAPSQVPKKIVISGIYQSPYGLEDAIRDAKSIDANHVAIASSDGAFRILRVISTKDTELVASDIDEPSFTAFDIAIWTTQVLATKDFVLVRGQDGSVFSVTWGKLP